MLYQKLTSKFPTTERDRIARNIAEVIDDLYRQSATPRDRNRLLDLVQVQVNRAMRLGEQKTRHRTTGP